MCASLSVTLWKISTDGEEEVLRVGGDPDRDVPPGRSGGNRPGGGAGHRRASRNLQRGW